MLPGHDANPLNREFSRLIQRAFRAVPTLLANVQNIIFGSVRINGLLRLSAGTNTASAGTVDLTGATGNTVHISGTTAITAWTLFGGQVMDVIFDGVLTLTHNATTNNLPGAANIVTEVGDRARVYSDGTTVYVLTYTRASGRSVVDRVAEYINWPIGSTPGYALVCNGAAVSRTTYARLFAIIGTTFGAGDGSTTFNLPNIPANYVLAHNVGSEASTSVGQVITHTHDFTSYVATGGGLLASSAANANPVNNTTSAASSSGSANLAAAMRCRVCIVF